MVQWKSYGSQVDPLRFLLPVWLMLLESLRGYVMRGKNEREMMGNRMKGIDANRIKDQGR